MASYRDSPDEPSFAARFLTAAVISIAVEGLRYFLYPVAYTPAWATLVALSLLVNLAVHWFNPPVSVGWTFFSAFYGQTTLPYTLVVVWDAVKKMVPPMPQ